MKQKVDNASRSSLIKSKKPVKLMFDSVHICITLITKVIIIIIIKNK